jgi:hypothetical protein
MFCCHLLSPGLLSTFTDMPSSETPEQLNPPLPPLPSATIQEYSQEEHMYKDQENLSRNLKKKLFFCFFPELSSPVVQ